MKFPLARLCVLSSLRLDHLRMGEPQPQASSPGRFIQGALQLLVHEPHLPLQRGLAAATGLLAVVVLVHLLIGVRTPRAEFPETRVVKGALTMKLAEEETVLGPLRERLAAEVLLLEDADLRKLETARRTLEGTMHAGMMNSPRSVRSQLAQLATKRALSRAQRTGMDQGATACS